MQQLLQFTRTFRPDRVAYEQRGATCQQIFHTNERKGKSLSVANNNNKIHNAKIKDAAVLRAGKVEEKNKTGL